MLGLVLGLAGAGLVTYEVIKRAPKKGEIPYVPPVPSGFANDPSMPVSGNKITASTLTSRGLISRANMTAADVPTFQGSITYVPAPGDTMDAIARRFGITTDKMQTIHSPISGATYVIPLGSIDSGAQSGAEGTASITR